MKVLFTAFVNELRLAVQQAFQTPFLLTAAVGAGKYALDTCYEIGKLGQALDLIHLMTYDYHSNVLHGHADGLLSPFFSSDL